MEDWRDYYVTLRTLPDGRVCGVHRLLMHWTVHIDLSDFGYEDRYCVATRELAEASLAAWDGQGDMPAGWHRHPTTGRRPDLATGNEWITA